MRILLLLGKYTFIAAALAAILYFGGRIALLSYAGFTITRDVNELKDLVKNPGRYRESCSRKFAESGFTGAAGGRAEVSAFQLRFVDDTTYVLEAVCAFHETEPVAIGGQQKLPPLVKKLPGSSGMLFALGATPLPSASVRLSILGVVKTIASGDGVVAGEPIAAPVSVCSGWGYSCCNSMTQVPQGDQAFSRTIDCPTSCYAKCNDRPVVLSFRSDPLADPATQTVTVAGATASMTFTIAANDPDGASPRLWMSYGDGKTEDLEAGRTNATHVYACPGGGCSYTAKIMAIDADGNTSPETAQTQITVRF